MGNIQKESQFISNNVQDTAPYSNSQYTSMVDNGNYNNFIDDGYGYGLVQWTYGPFKQDLLNRCRAARKSISDINCQLDQLYSHLQSENLLNSIINASSIEEATKIFMLKFEKPSDQSITAQNERIEYSKNFYNQFKKSKGGSMMKYTNSNTPIVCMQTNSTCYKGTSTMQVKGVLWHSTGANNTTIKRYVQPSENDANYSKLMSLIGKNLGANDWNHIPMQAGLNAWIGTLADGSVAAVQTMPWNYRPWGCGSGSKGSCNNNFIQFEICEDNLGNASYFNKVYQEACELTAYLCKMYNLNPLGTTNINGVSVPVILCHQDSYQLGLGSNHSDVYHWFNRYGKTMDDVRRDVAALMGNSNAIITPVQQADRDLGKGDFGDDVKELQKNLTELGYNCGSIDGDFGNNTLSAVLAFQRDYALAVDGIVGKATKAAIQAALKNKQPNTTTTATNELYRVRKTWKDSKSQIGAYKVLQNAIAACKKAGQEFKVFNSKGIQMYPTEEEIIVIEKPSITSPIKYNDVMVGSSSKDENGQYRGGQAGDQTNKEVYVLNWYNNNWHSVIRPKTKELAEKIASACEKGCANNKIGYNQNNRNSIYTEALKVGLDLSKITSPCDCDCSSFVSTCCICAGLSPSIFYSGGNMRITTNLAQACNQTNQFDILKSDQYTKSKDYLKRGDILLSDGHTVIVLADGCKASEQTYEFSPYLIRVNVALLNVRSGPSQNYPIVLKVKSNEVFTIVKEEGGWGKLKSGAGWIDLSYTQKV